mmetsp:Transcript_60070/g.159760  ORF Transcript_60070/g.159760 Transcript_60070/m.159760 type:complete len:168 (-) Transcript_60070:123-626(-)|eukprot:CAMPEP_0194491996 /NCGR_PEP_ID=MMETSP0253-20130528/10700_1 /TAXON_ID=2966 /ORGANISM="Noctiluca scintillans" /LENGTH=167 /DNA_ID=CAMNT_0039332799 /DNA_START=83 /DNA_END=586 /DNA_ORIENTATION=-
MSVWYGITTGPIEDICIFLSVFMLVVSSCIATCWATGLYKYHPWWAPVRKYDGHGGESQRINQFLLVEHMQKMHMDLETAQKDTVAYGALGHQTWGKLEAPSSRLQPFNHPDFGPCYMRESFAQTQDMRTHSSWWARDEPYFIAQNGPRMHDHISMDSYVSCAPRLA